MLTATLLGLSFLGLLGALLKLALHLTGALGAALIWLCIKLPLGLLLSALGLALCCTLILLPLGLPLMKSGLGLLNPLS